MSAEGIKSSQKLVTTWQDSSLNNVLAMGCMIRAQLLAGVTCQILIQAKSTSSQRLIT